MKELYYFLLQNWFGWDIFSLNRSSKNGTYAILLLVITPGLLITVESKTVTCKLWTIKMQNPIFFFLNYKKVVILSQTTRERKSTRLSTSGQFWVFLQRPHVYLKTWGKKCQTRFLKKLCWMSRYCDPAKESVSGCYSGDLKVYTNFIL